MKELIVLVASIMLGLFLFNLIAGEGDDSMYSVVKDVWNREIRVRTLEDGTL